MLLIMTNGYFNKLKRLSKQVILTLMTKEMRWRHQERSLRKTYEPLLAEAKGNERESLHQELGSEMWEIFRERQEHNDLKLIRKARRYDLPIPPRREDDGLWEKWGPGNWILTEKGSYHLIREIRNEQKERLALRKARIDVAIGWVPLITGLIGTLIGLFSLFWK